MINPLSDAFKLPGSEHDKIISPEETLENFKKRSSDANLHILKETRRIDNNRLNIPVYYSVCGHDAAILTGTKKQMGKGITPTLAEASAVMELAERFSLYSFMDDDANFIESTYDKIDNAIPFDLILKSVNDASLKSSEIETPDDEAVKTDNDSNEIKKKIFSMLKLKWTKAFNLTTEKEIYVPLDWFFMINEFNGSSAGNCNEEAICQGACEVVERHVSAFICKEQPPIPYIDPESVTNPSTVELIDKFRKAGIKFFIHDFSLNTGVPTVGALAWDPTTFPDSSEIVWTAGTAPSPDKALSRALTEVAQLAGDFNTSSNYVASGLPKFTSIEDAAWLIGPIENNTGKRFKIGDLPDISSSNIRTEVLSIKEAIKRLGFELITINTTDPRLKIPACYSIVPGTLFRERAENSSIVMFAVKHLHDTLSPGRAFNKILEINSLIPGRYEVEFYLGLCMLDMEQPDEALKYFEAAEKLNPARQDLPSIYSYKGVCLKDLGEYEKAIEVLEQGSSIDQEREDIFNLMGFCHFMLKNHELSISCFEKVLEIKPASGIDHASIGSNYRELGQFEKAIDFYEIALTLDPTLDFARENISKLKKLI